MTGMKLQCPLWLTMFPNPFEIIDNLFVVNFFIICNLAVSELQITNVTNVLQ